MRVLSLVARDFRSLESLRVETAPGITSVIGDNGSGKTNLLEAIYFALTGRSFRTRDRRELIRFGAAVGRAELEVCGDDGATRLLLASVSRKGGRRHLLDGSAAAPGALARQRPHVIVFSPDRLALVKGPPGERRAHLDGFIAARRPSCSGLRQEFGQALAQRNALLRRVAAGVSPAGELDAWDATLAAAAVPLARARAEAVDELSDLFATAAGGLGLESGTLAYLPRGKADEEALRSDLAERRESDLRRLRTSTGPHLDELELASAGHSLRRYGSQGQQRAALLALLFAERAALVAAGRPLPLLLLDDVMSELDHGHRDLLADRLADAGQTLISAADEGALPAAARERLLRMPDAGAALRAVA